MGWPLSQETGCDDLPSGYPMTGSWCTDVRSGPSCTPTPCCQTVHTAPPGLRTFAPSTAGWNRTHRGCWVQAWLSLGHQAKAPDGRSRVLRQSTPPRLVPAEHSVGCSRQAQGGCPPAPHPSQSWDQAEGHGLAAGLRSCYVFRASGPQSQVELRWRGWRA